MDRLATAIRYDPEATKNPDLVDLTRPYKRKDNASFLAEVARRLRELAKGPEGTWFRGGAACIGLLGEYGLAGATMRQAQAVLRVDRSPSHWSGAFLIHDDLAVDPTRNRGRASAWVWESTLAPAIPFNYFIERNGVGARRIADYANARFDMRREHSVPNMAILALGVTQEERAAILNRASDPNVDQLAYDLRGLLGTWYAFLTGATAQINPLATGHAVHSSAYLQLAYDAIGVDLAPGAHLKNTAPEHLWQMARYLTSSARVADAKGNVMPRPFRGWYCVRELNACIAPHESGEREWPLSLEDAISRLGHGPA